jgi:hypothetical protein
LTQRVRDIIEWLQGFPPKAKISFITGQGGDEELCLSLYPKEEKANEKTTKHVYVDIGASGE